MGLFAAACVVGGVVVGVAVVGAICDSLTEKEKRNQRRAYESYDNYRTQRERDIYDIRTNTQSRINNIYVMTEEEKQRIREERIREKQRIQKDYFENIVSSLEEQRKFKENLLEEINSVIGTVIELLNKSQNSLLRKKSLEITLSQLFEAKYKTFAYLIYLKNYEYSFRKQYEKGYDLSEPFEYLLPKTFPYNGKVMYLNKNDIQEIFELQIAIGQKAKFRCIDFDIIKDYDDNAVIPVYIIRFNAKAGYVYEVSCAKGLLKDNAIYKPGVGIEAVVDGFEKDRVLLDYYGLTLTLNRNNLTNPRHIPFRKSPIVVYPCRWDYNLNKIDVTQVYSQGFNLQNFETIPLIFSEEGWMEFEKVLDKLNLWDSEDGWRIGPLDESDIPDVENIKLQLGEELVFKGKVICEEVNKNYISYEGVMDNSEKFKPEDIFISVNAELGACIIDDVKLIKDEFYENMKNLSIFLFNEFKNQKNIKESTSGIEYYNKWAEVMESLIDYLQKDSRNVIVCNTGECELDFIDNRSSIEMWKIEIINNEEVREKLISLREEYITEYFVEIEGVRHEAKFKGTGELLYIFLKEGIKLDEGSNIIKVFPKKYPYPEVQQRKALNEFRRGTLVNSTLKPYLLNTANVTPETTPVSIERYFNKDIENNLYQREIIERAVAEKNFYLLWGPPGAGKTTVIKEVILQELDNKPNMRVLITSQTNVAVDKVINDLIDEYKDEFSEFDFVRCGNEEKIRGAIQAFSFERKYNDYKKQVNNCEANDIFAQKWKEYLEKDGAFKNELGELILKNHRIIGATCVGLAKKKIGLENLKFDLVIIDEASKALPAEMLIPILKAHKVLIIGDHKQLPPSVHPALYNEEKLEIEDVEYCHNEMYSKSLFERLFDNCPDTNKSMLKTQYRMPKEIGSLISELFYDNELENGIGTDKKLPFVFDKNLNWLDLSKVKGYEEITENGKSPYNLMEAFITVKLCEFIRDKTDDRIAVITPYKGQKREVRKCFKKYGINIFDNNIAVDTVDAFQGDEAEIVIYCTTRAKRKTDFFSDNARLNVAFSRAKREIIVLGSINYFRSYGENSALYRISEHTRNFGKIYNVDEFDISLDEFFNNQQVEQEVATDLEIKNNVISINQLEIPPHLKLTPPKRFKIERAIEHYLKNGKMSKPIEVRLLENNMFMLKDGYARFMAAKELKLEEIEVLVV